MYVRSILALGLICASAVPSLAADPPKPTVLFTAKPLSRLLTEYREMIRQVGGPAAGDQLVNAFDEQLKEHLGENGFEGIDINRPIAAYTVVKEKFADTNPILIVPVNGEKEFIEFLKRMKFEANAVKDKKGLYMIRVRGLDIFPNDSFVQFVDNWAYVGLNGDDVGDAKNRLPIDNLFDNADLSLFTVKLFPGAFPEKLLNEWLTTVEGFAQNAVRFAGAGGVPPQVTKMLQTFFDQGPKLLRRFGETGIKEANELRVQFSWEPNTGDTFTELTLIPKAGSPLAKDLASKAAATSRFAGLTYSNAVLAGVVKVPLFAKELREIVGTVPDAIEAGLKFAITAESVHPVLETVAKGATQSIKDGNMDVAMALLGPDKDGKFSVVVGISLQDTTAIDKALRAAAKAGDLEKEVEFDVAKVGGVGIHKVPLGQLIHQELHPEFGKLFGEKPPAYVALAKDAAFVSFGPESLAAIKTALEAKPGPAPVLELTGNTNRFLKFVAATGTEQEAADFAKALAPEDKQVSLLRVTVEGGATLKAKATLNLRYFPRVAVLVK